ncbi:MAG: prepilin-type N-terminal cleavage/methylation domain-containing protein [Sulfuricurvum sp.]|nr:prepilin-type N-terminal cleavage/methylation domain-containing protein [Sulfuricurvum sp.]
MKRSGFTMIELIFVIVILGILAAVAIPKLAATRDDAKASKAANDLATYIADVGSYYTAKGALDITSNATNVVLANDGCFTGAVSGSSAITIAAGASSGAAGCLGANSIASKAGNIGTKVFGGSGVTY